MIAAQLAELIGAEQVSADAEALAAHRFDRWCLKHWQDWQGEVLDSPACVVRPRDSVDVQAVVRFAAEHNVPVCLLYTSPSPRDRTRSRMPSSA